MSNFMLNQLPLINTTDMFTPYLCCLNTGKFFDAIAGQLITSKRGKPSESKNSYNKSISNY